MAEIKRRARAKINLALHVTGQRADGYHLLDSLVVFADVGDQLTFIPAGVTSLTIGGPFGDGLSSDGDNLVLQAARLLGNRGADIHLEKNLPVASGIGGGSADAAAALLGLAGLWDSPKPEPADALYLGADVPVCLASQTVRMQGIGGDLTPIDCLPKLNAVLVNPLVSVSTPAVFDALERKENAPIDGFSDQEMSFKTAVKWLSDLRNDLQAPAEQLVPEIKLCLSALERAGANLARMSGSGATCFGLFETELSAQKAADEIVMENPGWWCVSTVLG